MADHFFSPEARLDLLEIWEYIARDNNDAADRVIQEISDAITKLARNPQLGHSRSDLTSKPSAFGPSILIWSSMIPPRSRWKLSAFSAVIAT